MVTRVPRWLIARWRHAIAESASGTRQSSSRFVHKAAIKAFFFFIIGICSTRHIFNT